MPTPFLRQALGLATILAAVATTLGALTAAAQDKPTAAAASAAARPSLSVTVTSPTPAEWPQTLAANGSIAAWQEAVIGAEAAGLRLTELTVQVGDTVKRGQLLAQLQSATVRAELAATQASLNEARAVAAEADANAERARALKDSGAISTQQIQQYVTAGETARARVEALRARLAADELRLAQTRIVAPDQGVISARSATLGAVVQPGQELFRLIRQGRLEWRAEVAAADLVRVVRGMPVVVTPAGGAAMRGTVRQVAPTVDPATRNGLVYVDLAQPGTAKTGMFARGEFELGRTRVLTLPQSAVLLRDGFAYALRVGADQKVAMVKVGVGRRLGDRVEITSGLDASARVVASGVGFLGDGDTVRAVGTPAAGAASR